MTFLVDVEGNVLSARNSEKKKEKKERRLEYLSSTGLELIASIQSDMLFFFIYKYG